jgi:response regulator NasT
MPHGRLRILVAEDERDTREYLQEALARMGHDVVAAADGRQLAELAGVSRPDLILADIRMPGTDGLEAIEAVSRTGAVPVILLSAHHDAEVAGRPGAEHVMAFLVKPITEADLKAAIPVAVARFRMYRAAAEEAAGLRQALEERKVIERAKGILMKRLRLDEEDAFRRLRLLASSQNRKVIEVVRDVVAADEVFHRLEGVGQR